MRAAMGVLPLSLCALFALSISLAQTPIPVEFRGLYANYLGQSATEMAAALPCEELAVEYEVLGGGFAVEPFRRGDPMKYRISLRKNGQAEMRRNGVHPPFASNSAATDYVGSVNLIEYGKLCHLAVQLGVASLPDSYLNNPNIQDGFQRTTFISAGKASKTIVERNANGSWELWTFQHTLEAVAGRVGWKPK